MNQDQGRPHTTLYLIRHGATKANLQQPYLLQGRHSNPPLAPLGIMQAERTRTLLASLPFSRVYSSPLRRAMQTARIIATPRRCAVTPLRPLIECDVGRWERRGWEEIRETDALRCRMFERDPARHGYPEGESFQDVADRVIPCLERLLDVHAGETIVVVGHHVVNRVYLASLLGLPLSRAKRVSLDNCGVSIVRVERGRARVVTLNATLHLQAA